MSTEQQAEQEMQFVPSGSSQCLIPKRFIVTILGFLGMFNVYALRMNLSVAIVAMVNKSSSIAENSTLLYAECPAEEGREEIITESESKAAVYNWDSITQNQILSAFFYGYFITIPIGGYLAERLGGHRIFGAGVFLTSVLTLLTPISVQWGLWPLITLRALEGLCEGVTFPAMASVVSRWAPKLERSRIYSIIFSGKLVGNVVTYPVCGWLCSIDFLGGWPAAFYVFGVIGCAWYILWYVFVYESPFKHPFITSDEFELYQDCIQISKKAGLYSAFPNITTLIGSWVSSNIADRLRKSGVLSITSIRKIFNSLAGYVLALCFIIIPFCGCRAWLVVAIYSLGMFVSGFKCAGFQITSVDMSPTYSGILYGIANGNGAIMGIVAPVMVGALTESGANIENWSKVYFVAAAILTITTTVFALFSSAEVQPWDKPYCELDLKETEIVERRKDSNSYINPIN